MMWQIRYENNQTFIYLFIYSASPINYMYMKTTIQNSHTHTHTEKRKKSCMAGTRQQLSPITVGPCCLAEKIAEGILL